MNIIICNTRTCGCALLWARRSGYSVPLSLVLRGVGRLGEPRGDDTLLMAGLTLVACYHSNMRAPEESGSRVRRLSQTN